MNIWTTFCPSKICWELTFATTKGTSPTSNWLDNKSVIKTSLQKLKKAGISGIRLVIFPSELTTDGKKFDWTAVDTMLTLCQKEKLLVDLCLGPYQYPNYPGIYLPKDLIKDIFDNGNALDTVPALKTYGLGFLQQQMDRYAKHKHLAGFHLGNEWPDHQNVSQKEKIKKAVSEDFMLKAAALIKASTEKPIRLNTNIDAMNKSKLTNIFANIMTILGDQGYLGFDIYPSQETWKKTPLQKLLRLFIPYTFSLNAIRRQFPLTKMYFAEVEDQPWGNGQAWYTIINQAIDPEEKVLSYSKKSLADTWKKYIVSSKCSTVSLWGADFWLVADAMGINWPLKQITTLGRKLC